MSVFGGILFYLTVTIVLLSYEARQHTRIQVQACEKR